jgi:hypothetical protein
MEREGIPGRIDKSYLDNLAGGYQGQVFSALKYLGLMGEDMRVLPTLQAIVADPESREGQMRELVQRKYPWAVTLGQDATHGQLDEAFRENAPNLTSAHTREKAVTFYLHAAKFAGIPLSKHFKGVAGTAGSGGAPRRRSTTRRPRQSGVTSMPATPAGPPPASDEQRKAVYFDLLIELAKKSKDDEEVNPKILDRIERLLSAPTNSSDQTETEVSS